jgi:hypothetical protein
VSGTREIQSVVRSRALEIDLRQIYQFKCPAIADRELTGEVRRGGERGSLLVTQMGPLDFSSLRRASVNPVALIAGSFGVIRGQCAVCSLRALVRSF